MNDKDTKADCYSAGDRKFMVFTQNLRAVMLKPLLYILTKCGATADFLTFISFLIGLTACFAYFKSRILFLVLIALHVILDGFDGPLARYQNKASKKGSFTDTMSDQIVIAATTVTLIYAKVIGIVPGITYVFVYTVVIAFSMIRNAMKIPYTWLVRPRFVIYLWFIVEFYFWKDTVDYVLWFFIALLVLKMITGFFKIRKKI